MFYYYLPCLKPKTSVVGGLIGEEKIIKVGDILNYWDYPVIVVKAPKCINKNTPDYENLPVLKVKPKQKV